MPGTVSHSFLRLLCLLLGLLTMAFPCRAEEETPQARERNRKVVLTNLGIAAGILAYGTIQWDYFQTSPKSRSERWFGRDTQEGGMDKLGHAFVAYTLTDSLSALYTHWGYTPKRASDLAALSSFGAMTLMEAGDAFSGDYGFSWEDQTMNVAGVALAYILGHHPDLRRKMDYRLEYEPTGNVEGDILTDYPRQKYLLALKADGFDAIENPYLQYLELHLGYYARDSDDWKRTLYVGIGLNLGKLLHRWTRVPVFDYLQIPYTYLPLEYDLDE
jgi:hypothetical protein